MNKEKALKICQNFAEARGLTLQLKGEIGLGRDCVGYTANSIYVAFNPIYIAPPDYDYPLGYDDRLNAPGDVLAYHKHDCLAVLCPDGDFDGALIGLAKWTEELLSYGEVYIDEYELAINETARSFWGIDFGKAVRIR